MAETRQPASGIIASVIIMAISLAFISLFELSTFTGWVAYCIECVIPMQIVIGITWATKHPQFAASRTQPTKGILLVLVTILAGIITGALFFYTVNGGINPPTPFLMMFIIVVVLSTFAASIMWGGWPFMTMIRNPIAAGIAMLAACYLAAYIIFRVFFNYGFMQGAPVYVASLDPHGMFNAWSAVAYYVTVIGVMFLMLSFDLWPLTKFPSIMKQPVLGFVWSIVCLIVGYGVYYVGVKVLKMDVVSFMVHVPVAYIFGTIIVLNMLQGSLFGKMSQPGKGILNIVTVGLVGTVLFAVYEALSGRVTGVLKAGPPTYDFELWIASALLGVTFPLLVFHAEFFKLWPLKRAVQ
ncbi:MAG TPA: hypothetical protein VHZ74_22135 [Bryobacteraceae bacterium]|jgi:hypothetical protein|nr:hypothetical protein [Bryobacteraceae bacterium]